MAKTFNVTIQLKLSKNVMTNRDPTINEAVRLTEEAFDTPEIKVIADKLGVLIQGDVCAIKAEEK